MFLSPAVLVYSIFMVYLLLDSIRRSFFDDDDAYVGFDNFVRLFTDQRLSDSFWKAMGNNFEFFAIHMLVQNPIALLLAVLLTVQGVRGVNMYRTAIFIPTTLSLISVWQFVGMPMIFFYAVLVAIPKDLIDGASSWNVFTHVTLPLLMPMLGIVTIVTYVANFNAFDLIFTVSGSLAGPDSSADIMGTLFYRTFFGSQGVGSPAMGATVASAMFLVILLGILIYTLGWQRRVTTYEL